MVVTVRSLGLQGITGYGVAEVEILLDGEHYRTYEVDFDEGTSTQID